jgi:hypothetical protein
MFNKIYSAPIFSLIIKQYLLKELDVKYSGSKQLDTNTYKHSYELIYNAATLYEVDLLFVNTLAYVTITIPNVAYKSKEIELFDLDKENQETRIINTFISLCYELDIRPFK